MSKLVNGFTVNEYRDAKPWGQLDEDNFTLLFNMMPTYDTTLVDTVTVPNPHKHARLFDENEAQRAEMTSTLFTITQATHIEVASAGAVVPPAGTVLSLENSTNAYITGLVTGDDYFGLISGFVADNDNGQLLYFNSSVAGERNWKATVNAVGIATFKSNGFIVDTEGVGAIPGVPRGTVDITQGNNAGAVPALYLEQADVDEAFAAFNGSVTADLTGNISTQNNNGSHTIADCSGPKENWQHYGMLKVNIAGVGYKWIPLYTGS